MRLRLRLPSFGRTDRRRLAAERLLVALEQRRPTGSPLAERRVVEVVLETLEALVPPRPVTRGLAELDEGVDEREHRAVTVGSHFDAQAIGAPHELEHRRWVEGDDL